MIVQWALVFFAFLVGLFGSSLFSSWWAWPEVCLSFQKKQQLVLLTIFYFLISIYFLSDLHYFPSSDYALSILFLILSGSSLVASLNFPCFWRRPVLLCTSLLGLVLLHPTDFVWLWFYCHLSRGIFKFALWFRHWPIGF